MKFKVSYRYILFIFSQLQNNSNDVRTIKASFKCTSVHHNGSLANSIKSACGDFKLEPEQGIFVDLVV